MKQKIRNFRYKLGAIWWLVTRKNYYLLTYNSRAGKALESYSVVLPEFVTWLQKRHGMMTRNDIIAELRDIDSCLTKPEDIFVHNKVKYLIETLKNEDK